MKKINLERAFTLVELVVVIIVIGLLVAIALPRYQMQLEKGRTAEAYQILGSIRDDAQIYLVERGNLNGFDIDAEFKECRPERYFLYGVDSSANPTVAIATRCQAGGKSPNWGIAYKIEINLLSGALNVAPGNLPADAFGVGGGGMPIPPGGVGPADGDDGQPIPPNQPGPDPNIE